ncbi:hypothetical protein [Leucobacter komagatae]|uniref:Uncharacterized protein n=1 Tax=Leucobacter komagatae TaxID=55969 RepID=A0A0D0IN28_9MICO|nr:hypothetical protein [Leucobacter komagatae]KIP52974.1 hypothetical protein SD72_05575 [Leucobacter komagatae]
MPSESFHRLPSHVQQSVLEGLDEEIRAGFQKTEEAPTEGPTAADNARQIADGIVRSLALRNSFTGDKSTARDLGIGKRK